MVGFTGGAVGLKEVAWLKAVELSNGELNPVLWLDVVRVVVVADAVE